MGIICLKRKFLGSILLYFSVTVFLLCISYNHIITKLALLSIYIAYFIKYTHLKGSLFLKDFHLNSPLNWGFFFFFISAVISTVFSMNPYHSQKILLNRYLLYLLCFYAGFNFIRTSKEKMIFELLFFLSGIILGTGGLVFYFQHLPDRLFFSWNANVDIGIFAVLFLPFSFYYLTLEKEKLFLRICAGLGFSLLTICLLLNFSRGMFVSVVSGIIFILFLKKDKKTIPLIFIFIAIFLASAYLFKNNRLLSSDTWDFRIPYMKEGLKLFRLSPLFGKGLGSFELLKYIHPSVGGQILHVENLYIEILAQSGIIGLIAFSYIFWLYSKQIILNLNNLESYQLAIASGIFACLISGLFASVILVGIPMAFLFWFLLGISLSKTEEGT